MEKKADKQKAMEFKAAELKAIFKRHDRNQDGRLSKKDLKRAFEELGVMFPGWRAWRAICKADVHGDGFISSEQEYKDIVNYALSFIKS